MTELNNIEIANLKNLLEYQPKSVISRVLLKKSAGNITLFAFDQNEGLSEHTAPYDAFVLILDGSAEITISSKPYVLNANDSITMPANQPHALKAITPFKMLLVMIKSA